GKYTGSITIRSNGASQTVPVEWEVRTALPPPTFTYLQGPKGCEKSDGYPDPPLCAMLPLAGVLGLPPPGTSYTDPNFGARVRVMTGPNVQHPYSTASPLSAHNKYLLTFLESGTAEVIDVATGRVLARRLFCNQGCFWDAANDEVFYHLESASIIKHEMPG